MSIIPFQYLEITLIAIFTIALSATRDQSSQSSIMEAHFERVLADEAARSSRSSDGGTAAKRRKISTSKHSASTAAAAQAAHIEQLLAQADTQDIAVLDARAVKSMASALQKLIRTNALQRSKYADTPAKFMDSEVALDEELAKWKAVGSAPTLYAQVIELGVLPMLLGLFTHENLDIRLDVLSLLADWTDVDEADFSLEPTRQLVSELVKHKLLPLLVTNLFQLAQEATASAAGGEEEAVGMYNSMQILENLADIAPDSCEQVSTETEVFVWLLAQLGGKQPFSQNKLYASEILSILLQSSVAARQRFIQKKELKHKSSSKQKDEDQDALDQLLQAIAPYRKKNPATEEEEELVENLLNALCSVLLVREAQDRFRHLEGMELMLRCLKDNKLVVFRGALRVLDHAVMGNERNSERLIEIGGLKSLFSVLMGKKSGSAASKKKKNKQAERSQMEENVTSLVASLCALLRPDAKHDVYDRFHAKFVENDMEKMDRLVDLFVKYHTRVEQSSLQDEEDDDDDEEDAEAAADERYLRRLDAGLFVLQRIAFVVAHLCQFSRRHQAYVMIKFHERNMDMEALTQILREQVETMQKDLDAARAANDKISQDPSDLEAKATQNRKLMALVEALEASQAADGTEDQEDTSQEADADASNAEQEPVKNED